MTNEKRKGFTIVELVIVIAVVAILAGVLIPTFAGVIEKANQSSDIQAVRQMNVLLKAESVDKTLSFNNVIEIVSEAGYDTVEKRTPKSNNHGFYWHNGTNTIILVKTTNPAELIYPLDNGELRDAFDDKKANWANNHDGFEDLATAGTPATPTGAKIVDLEDLIAALENENDGEYYLDPEDDDGNQLDEITLSDFVEVVASVTIDLNGKELLIEGNPNDWSWGVISVKGSLSFEDSSGNKAGNIILDACTGTDGDPCAEYGIYVEEGEEGEEGGHLILDGVNIIGNMEYSIGNSGKTEIQNSKFIVKCGYGFYDYGGEAEINNCEMIADGEFATQVSCNYGIVNITDTDFREGTDFKSYYSYAPIEAYSGSKVTLDGVNVQTGVNNGVSVYASGYDARVTITGGTFNSKFQSENALITLKEDADGYFNGEELTVDYIMTNLCYGYDEKNEGTWYSIAHTINSDNQSFTLLGKKFHNNGGGEVPIGYDVTLYLNIQGFYIEKDIVVKGVLKIAYGDVRVGARTDNTVGGKIIVKPDGKLYLTSNVEVNEPIDGMTVNDLIKDYVTIEAGGTVYLDETEYSPS